MIESFSEYIDEANFEGMTLGIERHNMPQIAGEDVPAFMHMLDNEGVTHGEIWVNARKLRPSQTEYNAEKVAGKMSDEDFEEMRKVPIMISKDNFVLDGHHRYVRTLRHKGIRGPNMMKAHRINLTATDALDAMKRFPRTFYKSVNEDTDSAWESLTAHIREMFGFLREDGGAAAAGGDGGASSNVGASIPGSQEAGYGGKKPAKPQKKKDLTNKV